MAFPCEDQIESAMSEVFSAASKAEPSSLLAAFVPHYHEPLRWICFIPEAEVQELCEFVNLFKALDRLATDDPKSQTRFRLPIYCHVMEADFPPIVIWNLLRVFSFR